MDDILAKSQKTGHSVIPAKAGGKRAGETPIQCLQIAAEKLDSSVNGAGFHRCDDFLRAIHG